MDIQPHHPLDAAMAALYIKTVGWPTCLLQAPWRHSKVAPTHSVRLRLRSINLSGHSNFGLLREIDPYGIRDNFARILEKEIS